MAIFMYIYASLPQQVVIQEGVERLSLSRDSVFYITLGVVALINVLVFVFSKLYGNRNEPFSVWFFVQIILLNFFLITVLGYFNVLNSGERFSYDNLGIVIYGSVALVIIWAIGWPLYSVSRKIVDKQTV